MTPDWVGHLGLLEYASAAVAAVLLYLAFSWWGLISFGILYLCGIFAGLGGLVIKLMPHAWNLAKIEKHLEECRLTEALGRPLPYGASTDLGESLHLGFLANDLREEFIAGRVSVESVAAGYLPKSA
jgi:hypothetical protein